MQGIPFHSPPGCLPHQAAGATPRRNFAPRGVTAQARRDEIAGLDVALPTAKSVASTLRMFKIASPTMSLWMSGSAVATLSAELRILKHPCTGKTPTCREDI